MRLRRRAVLTSASVAALVALSTAGMAAPRSAASPNHAGGVVRPIPSVGFNANISSNWFGYNRGYLPARKLFKSIQGEWRVPTATQHRKGQAEHSSTWIGIGGGCVNPTCTVGDNTLIQAGTEQDVAANGVRSYGVWWELIPAPSISISMAVRAGDRIRVKLAEKPLEAGVWDIWLWNLTTHKTFHRTVPYTSTKLTAEWIEETPIVVGGGGSGLAALPNLTKTTFDNARLNGVNPRLKSAERILLAPDGTHVIGTPSAPQADRDGFGACAWATTCSVPAEL